MNDWIRFREEEIIKLCGKCLRTNEERLTFACDSRRHLIDFKTQVPCKKGKFD